MIVTTYHYHNIFQTANYVNEAKSFTTDFGENTNAFFEFEGLCLSQPVPN